jgi:hypothetical protein
VTGTNSDLISLKEFFLIYALTSRGDVRRRPEYAFEVYELNQENALELNEVTSVIYDILELFPESPDASYKDITKTCAKAMKVSVKKADFIEAMMADKNIPSILGKNEQYLIAS